MTIHCGVREGDGVSKFYKVHISQEMPNIGTVIVAAYLTGEASIELAQLWNSPFEGDTAGNSGSLSKGAAILQTQTDMTSKTMWNSKLVWEGAQALEFSLPLQFIAYSDAKKEVNDPIQFLMQMSSPELNDITPTGAIPQLVKLNVGRRLMADVYIKNVSYNENAPKTKDGYFTHNEITLQLTLDGSVNASEIPNIFTETKDLI